MKRTGFSVFLVRSARYGKTLVVSNAAHLALVTRADTSPELGHYDLGTPTYEFSFEGKSVSTTVPLAGMRKDGRRVYWDVAQERYSKKGALALSVRQERAELEGADYVLFESNVLGATYAEVKNRNSMQSYLYRARDRETHDEETACLMALAQRPLLLAGLCEQLALSLEVATVSVLRLWLKGRVVLPLSTQLLQPSWEVRRSDGTA